jgi:hypothetical protein
MTAYTMPLRWRKRRNQRASAHFLSKATRRLACPKRSSWMGVKPQVLHPGVIGPDCNASYGVASDPHFRNSML